MDRRAIDQRRNTTCGPWGRMWLRLVPVEEVLYLVSGGQEVGLVSVDDLRCIYHLRNKNAKKKKKRNKSA